MPPLIEARGISKAFPPVQALRAVDFTLRAGEIHTVAGENGSGKSTLIKILAGVLAPDAGTIAIDGEMGALRGPDAARALGIALVTQEGSLLGDLSVAENIFLGRRHVARHGCVDWGATNRAASAVLARLGLDLDPRRPVGSLSSDGRQLVEIARAASLDARVLLLDEPTSSLDGAEVAGLFTLLRRVRADGVGVLFVSHKMSEMLDISDRVTVLRDGGLVESSDLAATDESRLVRSMVGRDVSTFFPRASSGVGEVALEVQGLSDAAGRVDDVSLRVRAGEIVGLSGLVGAGRTELLETIVGARRRGSGTVLVGGEPLRGGPGDAIARGMVLLTDDRKAKGAVMSMSIQDNMLLSGRQPALRLRRRSNEAAALQEWWGRIGVRGGGLDSPISSLSGGNQQKVLLGRALTTRPTVILLDEPTRGIDIGAKTEIGRMICQLADDGAAVLIASSELPEILAICSTVLVMRTGRIAATLPREGLTEERVVQEALGAGELQHV